MTLSLVTTGPTYANRVRDVLRHHVDLFEPRSTPIAGVDDDGLDDSTGDQARHTVFQASAIIQRTPSLRLHFGQFDLRHAPLLGVNDNGLDDSTQLDMTKKQF